MADEYDLGEVKELSTLICDKLVELILGGVLEPGERLVQNDLASRFGVSRVAIRDALMKLRHRGLSVNVPLRGEIVRPVTRKSVSDVFAVRRLLEPYAVREAVRRMDEQAMAALRVRAREQAEAVRAGDVRAALEADWELHASIYGHCGNSELYEMIEELWRRIRQARSVAGHDQSWGEQWSATSVERHRNLLDAIARRDADRAGDVVESNIDAAAKELILRLEKHGWE